MVKTRRISWNQLQGMTERLYDLVTASEFSPYIIVGISRGGLLPASILSHMFSVPMIPIVWSTRDFERKEITRVREIKDWVEESRNILVVDDICDTGKTFSEISSRAQSKNQVGALNHLRFSSIHVRKTSNFVPDFSVETIFDDSWIVYPYEIDGDRKIV